MGNIDKMQISGEVYDISPSGSGTVDSSQFTSNDTTQESASEYTQVTPVVTTDSNSTMFGKFTTMIKNLRYIFNRIGTHTLAEIGDTITESIYNTYVKATTKATDTEYGVVKIGNGIAISEGTISIDKSTLLDMFYPIGTIYESTNAASPADLFGGTWKTYGSGQVLLGTSNSHPISGTGSTGGSETVTLTTSQIPSHSHTASSTTSEASSFPSNLSRATIAYSEKSTTYYAPQEVQNYNSGKEEQPSDTMMVGAQYYYAGGSSDVHTAVFSKSYSEHNHSISVNVAGGSGSHNNMPPYITVYRWQRIA